MRPLREHEDSERVVGEPRAWRDPSACRPREAYFELPRSALEACHLGKAARRAHSTAVRSQGKSLAEMALKQPCYIVLGALVILSLFPFSTSEVVFDFHSLCLAARFMCIQCAKQGCGICILLCLLLRPVPFLILLFHQELETRTLARFFRACQETMESLFQTRN